MCDLREVDLVRALRIAQPVLVSIRVIPGILNMFELLQWAIPVHFEVNADPAIHRHEREMNIEISNSSLDDFAENLIRFLVVCDAAFNPFAQPTTHTAWDSSLQIWWEVEETISLSSVFVNNRDTMVCASWTTRMRGLDYLVQEIVVLLMGSLSSLVIIYGTARGPNDRKDLPLSYYSQI